MLKHLQPTIKEIAKIRYILLCSCLLGGLSIHAQTQLKIEQYGSEEGFFGSTAFDIMQDSRGFLWIGTTNGAYRFDGYTFTAFNREGDGSVGSIYEDKKGKIWLSFHVKVVCIDPLTDSSTTYTFNSDPLEWDRVWLLTEDQQGNICIVARSGLYKFNSINQQFECFQELKDLPDNYNLGFKNHVRDSTGNIWSLGATAGLLHFDLQSEIFTSYLHDPQNNNSLSSAQIKNFTIDREGIIWIITKDGVINSFNPANQRFNHYHLTEENQTLLASLFIRNIIKDGMENLWGDTDKGLIRINISDRRLIHYRTDEINANSLINGSIIFADRENNIWTTTIQSTPSLYKLRQSPFKLYQHNSSIPNSISSNFITAIEVESDTSVWVGTAKSGLNRLNPQKGKFIHYDYNPSDSESLSDNAVRALLADSRGNVWIGTQNGLNVLSQRTNQFIRYLHDPNNGFSISDNNILSLFEDSQKRIWVGLFGDGLIRYDFQSGKFIHYQADFKNPKSLRRGLISDIHEDQEGILWISDMGSGLVRFDPNHPKQGFTYFHHEPEDSTSLGSPDPIDIHEDRAGNLWIATLHSGLNLMDKEKGSFRRFTEREGLANHFTNRIAEDDHGRLWITTINGLSCFDPISETFTNYDKTDGLSVNSFGPTAPITQDSQTGEMYVGSNEGMIVFHPDSLRKSSFIPPVVITSLEYIPQGADQSVMVKGISLKKEVRLSYRDDVINIQFAALSFSKTAKNQYRYQVEGIQEQWIDLGTQRQLSFTNLDPGTYTLRVMGSNGDGLWNPEPTELTLIISPPWWWNIWSQSVYFIAILAFIFAFYRWRTDSLRRQRQLLRTRVFEQTQEIRKEQERSDELLANILPAAVAQELKATGKTKAVFFEDISIMFADFKGFTNIVASIPGKKLVEELDDIFQAYDDIMEEIGLEKIQTVGDAYLAAGGLPTPDPDHAIKCVKAAQKIIAYLEERNQREGIKWNVRIGIHSGAITAGVIGKKKFSYDLFGDTINIAARIESASKPDHINVSAYTYTLIKDHFSCTYRGKVNAKGKGELDMYFVDI